MKISRTELIVGIVVVIVAIITWFGYFKGFLSFNSPESHKVSGIIKSIKDGQIIISGLHVDDASSEAPTYSLRKQNIDLIVNVDANTKLVKTVWHVPFSREYLLKHDMLVDSEKIQKEDVVGSVDDFKNSIGMPLTVKTVKNSINDIILQAIEIDYIKRSYAK